jgi:uncharacterized protein (TIGR00299 family) protein
MRTLAFDGQMGASGDMLLGALLAAGADRAVLTPVEDALEVTYAVDTVQRAGIAAVDVDVRLGDEGGQHAEGHGPHRHYGEVVDIVEDLDLPADVEADALAIFERLGEAEAAVHGTDLESTHFHEVGADDAIADVVGTCLLLADLDVERVVTTPVAAGHGEVETSHGTYPVPVPAVVELAERADWRLRSGPIEMELLTPTGAAILAHLATGVEYAPAMSIADSGYGAGSRAVEGRPNVLRAIVGESDAGLDREPITVLETNVDDVTPEVLGGLQETLADAGALDVSIVPTTMKKSRPGHLVRVVTAPADAERVARRLAEETGTLGVREHGAGHRWVADREQVVTDVEIGGTRYEVGVKVGRTDEGVFDLSAEYDDALAVARETGRPVREVMRLAEAAARDRV